MPWFSVKADVSVEVEISVEAASAEQAEELFDKNLCVTASLVDVAAEKQIVAEDSIDCIRIKSVHREDE